MTRPTVLLAVFLAAVAAGARAADVKQGEAVFARCKMCHTVAAGGETMLGPNLHGLFGRKAGSVPDYDYSTAMRHSGIVWDDQTLAQYLRNPSAFVPGNRMGFPGIKNEEDLDSLLLYLKQATR